MTDSCKSGGLLIMGIMDLYLYEWRGIVLVLKGEQVMEEEVLEREVKG